MTCRSKNGLNELVVGSEDFEIRVQHVSTQEKKFNGKSLFAYNQVFNNDEIVTEITETEAVTHLTAVQVVEVTCWTVAGL